MFTFLIVSMIYCLFSRTHLKCRISFSERRKTFVLSNDRRTVYDAVAVVECEKSRNCSCAEVFAFKMHYKACYAEL